MSTSNQILVIDVNVIIHLEKAGLLDELISDSNIRIVDLVLYDEYQYKKNLISDKIEKIKLVTLKIVLGFMKNRLTIINCTAETSSTRQSSERI